MVDVDSRPSRGRSVLDRVESRLARDFPGLDLALSTVRADLEAHRARAVVVPATELAPLPPAGLDQMAFPAGTSAAGAGLVFREGDGVLQAIRRFYLPPVILAGAGPGGIGTMTVAATHAVAEADVILADCLCGDEVLRFAKPSAVCVPVGKRGGKASTKQGAINDRMLEEALRGKRVVRLKGGDPSVFGRLEEEVSTLTERRLPYRVLPGVGAASGAAAFIGQPLTVREIASELILSTGRLAGGGRNPFPLEGAAAPAIALYMSRKVLVSRMADLLEAGFPPSTHVAVVEKLGAPGARAVTGTIEDIAARCDEENVGTPAVVLVGAQYAPPDHLPLHGVRIWLPAERETGEAQREVLEELGAVCIQQPLIEPVALAIEEGALLSGRFDWVVFTSKKSPDFLFQLLSKWGYDARWLPKVAAIGGPTIEKLRARGIEPDLIPPEPTRKSLCETLIRQGLEGQRVLVPASAVAPDGVRETLAPHAAEVVRTNLYTLHFPRVEQVPDADVVLFSSESTVRSARASGLLGEIERRGMVIGGIGPNTWRTIEEEGLSLLIRPEGTDPAALARATRLFYARRELERLQEDRS